jgi:chromosome segregation ATPase
MPISYQVLLDRYKVLRQKINSLETQIRALKRDVNNYKYLYEQEKWKQAELKKEIQEQQLILDMFYKKYYGG